MVLNVIAENPKIPTMKLRANLAGIRDRFDRTVTAAANMAASMIEQLGRVDIASAGAFGGRWIFGLHVTTSGALPNMRLSMTHDVNYAGIFETGGTIHGHPFLYIPISGTDAVGIRARDYGGLFSPAHPNRTGKPLLFSIADKKPRYFGVESVTIPPKFHLRQDIKSVMANFRNIFDAAWKAN